MTNTTPLIDTNLALIHTNNISVNSRVISELVESYGS